MRKASKPKPPAGPCYTREAAFAGRVAGVDEAGRGPWAGPVVAAAVVLDPDCIPDGLNDSKQLSHERRTALLVMLVDCAEIGVGTASVAEIDEINIHWATMLAMERAVAALARDCDHVLVDGNRQPRWTRSTQTIVSGDALCVSIAAASIVAKVTRDRLMIDLAAAHDGYGWATNKGYGTPEHAAGLRGLGPCLHHRQSFWPVREWRTLEPRAFRKASA